MTAHQAGTISLARPKSACLRDFAAALGQTLRAAEGAGRKLYGFAEHQMESTFLGTSAGLRLAARPADGPGSS